MALLRNDTHDARCQGGAPVPAGLALHQNILHVVLDDRIRFVRLAKEAGPVLDFIRGVGNLAPEDALEIVKAELPAMLLDRSVEGYDGMPTPVAATGQAYIPNHYDESPPCHKGSVALRPNAVKLCKEGLIVRHIAELAIRFLLLPG